MSKEITDAKRRAIKKYDAANTKQLHLKLNLKTDADILAHLEQQESVQGYIKALIREDMNRAKPRTRISDNPVCNMCWNESPVDRLLPCSECPERNR